MAQSTIIDRYSGLVVGSMNMSSNVSATRSATGGYRITLPQFNSTLSVWMPQATSWANYTHVDLRLTNNGTKPAAIEMDCYSRDGAGWLISNVVVGVGESLNVSMPLRTATNMGLRALPSISDAVRSQTASFGSIYPDSVKAFFLFNKAQTSSDITIESMVLARHTVPSTAIVDVFGQQKKITWKGKVTAGTDLRAAAAAEVVSDQLPYSTDASGGILGGKNYGKASNFRTVKDNGHWYLVTPQGNRFFSMGVNEVGAHAWTPVQGREDMFSSLDTLKSGFPSAWSTREGVLGFIPYQINLQKKYGSAWRTTTENLFLKRLKTWGFNTLGTNSWESMISNQRLASTFSTPVYGVQKQFVAYDGRAMYDVFAPEFAANVLTSVQTRILQTGTTVNPMNIGIFVDNEMPWGIFAHTDSHYRYAIAVGALRDATTFSHGQLIAQLKAKYVTIDALNAAWGTQYTAWTSLDVQGVDVPVNATAAMQSDFAAFGKTFARKYFSTVKGALNTAGFKGLYLGCRFMGTEVIPEIIDAAKESCDIISVNLYHVNPSASIAQIKNIDFPIMISEFCFGASDLGRVGMPLYATQTETARIDAYKRFIEDVKTWPNLVGAHWYRWEDFPATGKVDLDNMSEGLISITDNPYTGLTAQTRQSTIDLMNFFKGLP